MTGSKMDAAMGLLEWVTATVGHGWDVVIQRGHAQDWPHITANILHIVLAYALAFPIGWERGKNYNIAGLRTFPIVAMASCGYALAANDLPDFNSDAVSRVIQGLVAGIGFIGGGAIVKEAGTVQGVATAASIWNTGAIGIAVAYGNLDIAITLTVVNFLTLWCLTPISEKFRQSSDSHD
jgi:putative Mg2+ transporter-C (MgtC) family protein